MELQKSYNPKHEESLLICRQGRIAAVISTTVLTIILVGSPVVTWWMGAPFFFWIIFALLALLVVPMFIGDVLAKLRPGNWLLVVRTDGLCINLRSYQDRAPSGDDMTVVRLEYREINEVVPVVEYHSKPDSDGSSTRSKMRSLDIRLMHEDTETLASAIATNRHRVQSTRTLLFMSMRAGLSHFAVSIPQPDTIRLLWRGDGHWVTPSLRRTLATLETRVKVAESTQTPVKDWKELSDTELDDRILELTRSGNRMDAIKLLVQRRGYSLTDAHHFIDELSGRV